MLEAVIRSYVETAEPAGSRTLSRRFGLGVSPATIRNTMSDLEEKGFLFHPHTSAGRVPTDKAYRVYVDSLLSLPPLQRRRPSGSSRRSPARQRVADRDDAPPRGADARRADAGAGRRARARLDDSVLRRLELVRVSSERLLMVLTLDGGVVRTIFVEVPGEIADSALGAVTAVLNERLAGLTLGEIRGSLAGAPARRGSRRRARRELLNIFVQEGEQLFDAALPRPTRRPCSSAQTSVLAEQPEFSAADRLRRLLELTERRTRSARRCASACTRPGISITIGAEHDDPRLEDFTVVTAEYHVGRAARA